MKNLFEKLGGTLVSPVFMRKLNGIFTLFWLVMVPVSFATGLVNSVAYVSAISLWALVSTHLSAWVAGRVEVHQEKDADVQEVLDAVNNKKSKQKLP